MRRIVLAAGGTAAGVAMLLAAKSYTGTVTVPAGGGAGAAGAPAASAGPGAGAASGSGTAAGAGATPRPGTPAGAGSPGATRPAQPPSGPTGRGGTGGAAGARGDTGGAGTREVTGGVATTAYGPVQIGLAVTGGRITKVTILQQPTATAHDLQLGQFAFPRLEAETLTAQTARISAVSGATYTSEGYIQSLQSAIDQGA